MAKFKFTQEKKVKVKVITFDCYTIDEETRTTDHYQRKIHCFSTKYKVGDVVSGLFPCDLCKVAEIKETINTFYACPEEKEN